MNNFKSWGLRVRRDPSKNYYSVWNDLVTTRPDVGEPSPLDPDRSEFYDVGITERCNAGCSFCYVEAGPTKKDYQNVCETWKAWMDSFPKDTKINPNTDPIFKEIITEKLDPSKCKPEEIEFQIKTVTAFLRYGGVYTEKPDQIAIGSVGEGTVHPDFCKFLETVFETRVVPNYTTNGIILGDPQKNTELLEATRAFCGGVAVSFGNKALREHAKAAVSELLLHGQCKVMIHEIIGTEEDVDDLLQLDKEFGSSIHYHVLLPLMEHGRSKDHMTIETYDYLTETITRTGMTNVAFGANFLPFMKERPGSVNVWEYPSETYSKNILLKDGKVIITPSSFRLEPIKTIDVL